MTTPAYRHGAQNRAMGFSRKDTSDCYPLSSQWVQARDAERGWDDMDRFLTLSDIAKDFAGHEPKEEDQ